MGFLSGARSQRVGFWVRLDAQISDIQKEFTALAVWSRLRHPNLMPLLGLVPACEPGYFVLPSIPLIPRHYPFRPHSPLRSVSDSESDEVSSLLFCAGLPHAQQRSTE